MKNVKMWFSMNVFDIDYLGELERELTPEYLTVGNLWDKHVPDFNSQPHVPCTIKRFSTQEIKELESKMRREGKL